MTYEELKLSVTQKYEYEYMSSLIQGQKDKAYEALGNLMKYRLIDKNDTRLSKTKSPFKGTDLVDKYFEWDYRRGEDNFLPMCLYFDCPRVVTISLKSYEHCGKRVENGYTGDVFVSERNCKVTIRLCKSSGSAKVEVEKLIQNYEDLVHRKINGKSILSKVLTGEIKLYTIAVESDTSILNRNLGHAILQVGEKGLQILIIMNHRALKINYFSLVDAYTQVGEALKNQVSNLIDEEHKIYYSTVIKFSSIKEEQAELDSVRESNNRIMLNSRE